MRKIVRPRVLSVLAVLFAAPVLAAAPPLAAAQEDAGIASPPDPGEPQLLAEATEPSVEARLAALEAESQARAQALDEARARVLALETAAAAEEAVVAPPAGPTIRPLASMVTRFEHREGYDALGSARALQNAGCFGGAGLTPTLSDSDCIRYRARVGFEITNLVLGPEATAVIRFLPQVSGNWALPGLGIGVPGGTGASSSGGIVDAVLGIHEASLALQLGTVARVEVGRFEMNYGDAVVVGNLDWHPNGRAFDGARVRVTPQGASSYWIDAFWTLINEGHSVSLTGAPVNPGFGQADQSFYGVYAGLGSLLDARPSTALDVYALFRQTNNRSATDPMGMVTEREWSLRATIGARFRYRLDLVDFRVEGAFQTGREGGSRAMPGMGPFGSAALVLAGFGIGEVGVNLLEDHMRIALEGNYASGNAPCRPMGCVDSTNEGYDPLFPTAHAFLGFTDVMGNRSNVASGVFHFVGRPIDQLAINLDWHVFVVPERAPTVSGNYAGQEANLTVLWTPWPGFRTRAMYGVFIPDTAAWRQAGMVNFTTNPVHFLEVEIAYVLR